VLANRNSLADPSLDLNVQRDWVVEALREISPSTCGVACELVRSKPSVALPEEEAIAVRNTADVRKCSFQSGRIAARAALEKVGFKDAIIPMGADRAPIWPKGAVGSIAHAAGLAIAVAAEEKDVGAIGVDIEDSSAVSEDIWAEVLVAKEIEYLKSLPSNDQRRLATVFFCIKEAFYKFQYQHTRAWLGFEDVEVALAIEKKCFRVKASRPINLAGRLMTEFDGGRFIAGDSFTIAAAYLTTNGDRSRRVVA
jgi:4'-phosphopantetheinyl transferase EntD